MWVRIYVVEYSHQFRSTYISCFTWSNWIIRYFLIVLVKDTQNQSWLSRKIFRSWFRLTVSYDDANWLWIVHWNYFTCAYHARGTHEKRCRHPHILPRQFATHAKLESANHSNGRSNRRPFPSSRKHTSSSSAGSKWRRCRRVLHDWVGTYINPFITTFASITTILY